MKNTIFLIFLFASLINAAFSSNISLFQTNKTTQVELALSNNAIDVSAYKINIIGQKLNQPIIITPENLDEWGRINFKIIPPDNYSSDHTVDLTFDSGRVWHTLRKSLFFDFTPENEITNILGIRVIAQDSIGINIFNEYPLTYLADPEEYYSGLIKNIITISYNNKDTPSFMKYISGSYTDPEDNRYEDIEDKLNIEFDKYKTNFTIKNYAVSRLDMAKFKVQFDWTKSIKNNENNENNNVKFIFGKSIYIFENNLIITAYGDPIFTDHLLIDKKPDNPGILKGGTVNLIPNGSFEFVTGIFDKDDILKGDIGVKKEGNHLLLYVPGGVIQDMGIIQLSGIVEAPDTGYSDSAPVIIGHSYCLRNNNNRFAKLQVTYVEGAEIGQTSILVSINWIFQESESKSLKPQ